MDFMNLSIDGDQFTMDSDAAGWKAIELLGNGVALFAESTPDHDMSTKKKLALAIAGVVEQSCATLDVNKDDVLLAVAEVLDESTNFGEWMRS